MPARAPSRRARLLWSALIGALAGTFCWLALDRPGAAPDFLVFWSHARSLIGGANPYAEPLVIGPGRVAPFMYPLPAALLVAPFAWLPMAVSGGAFFGFSSALLAYLITRDGFQRLPLFFSAPFILAATMGQWAPFIMAVALVPVLSGLIFTKPNLGVALALARPDSRTIASAAVIFGATLLLIPRWPLDWLLLVRDNEAIYRAPLLATGGLVLLLALIRWRHADGRLLLGLSIVPQLVFFYDQLVLWLVPRTLGESIFMSVASLAAWLAWLSNLAPGAGPNEYIPAALPFVLGGIYLPALVLVLRHGWQDRERQG